MTIQFNDLWLWLIQLKANKVSNRGKPMTYTGIFGRKSESTTMEIWKCAENATGCESVFTFSSLSSFYSLDIWFNQIGPNISIGHIDNDVCVCINGWWLVNDWTVGNINSRWGSYWRVKERTIGPISVTSNTMVYSLQSIDLIATVGKFRLNVSEWA